MAHARFMKPLQERADLWEAMAEQFLDTERRHEIPALALMLVNAGLLVRDAARMWQYEVTPAVWQNLWSVAGEWAIWNTDWLVVCIERKRVRWANQPGPIGYLIYRFRVGGLHRIWRAIAGCMRFLAASPAEDRDELAKSLGWLARHHFDFLGEPGRPKGSTTEMLALMYAEEFLPIFANATLEKERARCAARVWRALSLSPGAVKTSS